MTKINEEFFNSTADATIHKLQRKIAQLEHKIEEFKEYDKKRQEYYKDAMIRLGQLESFVDEMSSDDLVNKLKVYKNAVHLSTKLRHLDKLSRLTDIEIVSTFDKETSENTIAKLKKENSKLRELYNSLLYKYGKLLEQMSSSVEGSKRDGE